MSNLKVVTEEKQQEEARKQEKESLLLTRAEIAKRVNEIRKELETAKQRYDGALFDNYTDGIPPSLDIVDVNRAPFGAVYHLSPRLERMLKNLQDNADPMKQSDDVFELFFWGTHTAYALGMLAGAIYADLPQQTVDRWERGLVTALSTCHWIVKEGERL